MYAKILQGGDLPLARQVAQRGILRADVECAPQALLQDRVRRDPADALEDEGAAGDAEEVDLESLEDELERLINDADAAEHPEMELRVESASSSRGPAASSSAPAPPPVDSVRDPPAEPVEPPEQSADRIARPRVHDAVPHIEWVADVREDGLPRIRYDTQQKVLLAYCKHPRHGKACRVTRTTAEGRASKPAQGRPLGFLLSWLKCAECFETAKEHMAITLPGVSLYSEHLRPEVRSRNRLWMQQTCPDAYAQISARERPRRDGEADEPEDWV